MGETNSLIGRVCSPLPVSKQIQKIQTSPPSATPKKVFQDIVREKLRQASNRERRNPIIGLYPPQQKGHLMLNSHLVPPSDTPSIVDFAG
jgi:hypothetical protein